MVANGDGGRRAGGGFAARGLCGGAAGAAAVCALHRGAGRGGHRAGIHKPAVRRDAHFADHPVCLFMV